MNQALNLDRTDDIATLPSTPTLKRRFICAVYESVILFGIVFSIGYLFGTLTQQRSGLTHRQILLALEALGIGFYFVWFWQHGGQTLPMKTWHIKLVDAGMKPVSALRACYRYILSWLWFLPPLALHPLLHLSMPATLLSLLVWVLLWATLARANPSHQFLHDRLAGTRLVMHDR